MLEKMEKWRELLFVLILSILYLSLIFEKGRFVPDADFLLLFFLFAFVSLINRIFLLASSLPQKFTKLSSSFLDLVWASTLIFTKGFYSPFILLFPVLSLSWSLLLSKKLSLFMNILSTVLILFLSLRGVRTAGEIVPNSIYCLFLFFMMEAGRRIFNYVKNGEKTTALEKKIEELEEYSSDLMDLTSIIEYEREIAWREKIHSEIILSLWNRLKEASEIEQIMKSLINFVQERFPCDFSFCLVKIYPSESFSEYAGNKIKYESLLKEMKSEFEKEEGVFKKDSVIICTSKFESGRCVLLVNFNTPYFASFSIKTVCEVFAVFITELFRILYVRKLKEISIKDELTGLYNHRYLFSKLDEEIIRAKNCGHPLSLIMCDFDDFKEINDEFGHLEGDVVLKMLSDIMKGCLRKTDIPCRYGGDEFVFILPGTSLAGAKKVAEKILNSVASQTFTIGDKSAKISLSLAGAEFKLKYGNGEEFLREIDNALMKAKLKGKGQIIFIE